MPGAVLHHPSIEKNINIMMLGKKTFERIENRLAPSHTN
jgi:hypothetical protein